MAWMGLDEVFAVLLRNDWGVRWSAEKSTGIVYCRHTGGTGDTLINRLPGEDRATFRYWIDYRGMLIASYWDTEQASDLQDAWEKVKSYLSEHEEGTSLDIQGVYPESSCDILVALAVNRATGRLSARVESQRLLYKLTKIPQKQIVFADQQMERELAIA